MRIFIYWFIIGLIFGSLLFFVVPTVFGQEPSQPTRAVPQDQCVRIIVQDRVGHSMGSGALIGDKVVVTANHVVKDRATDKVTVNFPGQSITGNVIGVDKDFDIAFVVLDEMPKCKPFEVSITLFIAPLSVQGYGRKGKYRQRWGMLSDSIATGKGESEWRKVDVGTRSGDSGGPVIDVRGAFVGTLWGSVDGNTYFTPADKILKLLERIKVNTIDIKIVSRYHARGRVERFFKRSTPELLGGRYHSRKRVDRFFKRSTRKAVV
jgi:S1-C subfamily serine protease